MRAPRWLHGKEPSCQCRSHRRPGFNPWVGKIPWRRKWQPMPVFLPGESYGQRSLVGYSPWGTKSQTQLKWLSTVNCLRNYWINLPWQTSQEPCWIYNLTFQSHSSLVLERGILLSFQASVCILFLKQFSHRSLLAWNKTSRPFSCFSTLKLCHN